MHKFSYGLQIYLLGLVTSIATASKAHLSNGANMSFSSNH